MDSKEPPVIDFAPFYGPEWPAKERLISELRQACREYGFFQLINHAVPAELQESVMRHSQDFFALPTETKERYGKDIGGFNRGYERLRAQNLEKRTQGDLNEGFYMGKNPPLDDPYVNVMDDYHAVLTALAMGIMQMIARTLHLDEDVFHDFCEHPVAVLRLLHYPPQGPKAAEDERVNVTPIPGAYVVNLGNMMMQWTNDQYLSNIHRVINKSGKERFGVLFFFSENPDYTIRCLPSCEDSKEGARYAPITVGDTSATKAIGKLRNDLVVELSAR
ncbi:Clavaminate synthase-like protein [Aspergillus uvarum CBS 121591]|uniref:Clavaminate synthase-like protein n=1 Tax=Aspergillus uvarum CBS 121591 TaxID=1448315 RepID=A0A319BXY2_9EURO|nr:Clavaminate synthase-like protein [Aspergillus uvarum CBS 121591]PYH78576.1 Clavaminate synthase-like protein [Aspergillus uvarum CBS 121591]